MRTPESYNDELDEIKLQLTDNHVQAMPHYAVAFTDDEHSAHKQLHRMRHDTSMLDTLMLGQTSSTNMGISSLGLRSPSLLRSE